MSTLDQKRIRFFADESKLTSERMADIYTDATPEMWRGNDVQFEIGIGHDDAIVEDVSNIASVTLDVKPENRTGAALITKTVQSGDINTITQDNWDNKKAQNILVEFAGAETNIDMLGNNERDLWLVISYITNDNPGKSLTLQHTIFKVVEDGTGSSEVTAADPQNYYSKAEADARYVQKHAAQARSAWSESLGCWCHYIAGGATPWYPEVPLIKDGVPQLTLGDGIEKP